MATNEIITPIPCRLRNATVGGHVAGADQIVDENQDGKSQQEINAEVYETIGGSGEGSIDTRIQNAIENLDSTKSHSANGLTLSISEEDGKITSISGSIAEGTYDPAGAAETVKQVVVGGASSRGNTLKLLEDRISPLESALGNISKNAASYGFLPTADAATNAASLQAAVEGGNTTVIIDKPGTYQVNDTILLDSNTTLIFGAGVTVALKKTDDFVYKRFLLNRGALTKTYNENISVIGLKLSAGSHDISTTVTPAVYGLRGYIAFFYVKNLVIDNFTLLDGGAGTFVIHICTFEDIKLTNIHIEGNKDGIHLGRGKRFLIRDCEFKTYDDPLAFNARDYENASPEFGWIENGLVENITELGGINNVDGFFCRMLGGSWLDWASGNSYQKNGDVCVNNGKVYITVASATTAKVVSTEAPTCDVGQEQTIGELKWRCIQTSNGEYNCGNRNITFRNIHILQTRVTAFNMDISNDKYTRCFYPGSTPPSQDNMVFDNITAVNLSNSLVVAKTPANVIKIVNSRFVGRGTYMSGGSNFFGSDCPPYHILWSNLTFAHASGNEEVIRNAAGCPGDLRVIGSVVENSGFNAKKAVSNFTVTSDITIA